MFAVIDDVRARRVWDSRGRPTVEVEIGCGAATGRAIAPSGASRGDGEALDRRDGGNRFGGLDVRHAVAAVNDVIAPALIGRDATQQEEIDHLLCDLDGTAQKLRLGGNATVATSMAVAWVAARAQQLDLWEWLRVLDRSVGSETADERIVIPLPEIQIIGGGAHAAGALDLQDLMVVCPGASDFAEALDWTAEIYLAAGAALAASGRPRVGVADEGGWWPQFRANEEAIEFLATAIQRAGFSLPQVGISLDVAAGELERAGNYHLGLENRVLRPDAWLETVLSWTHSYPVLMVEDPCSEHDPDGMRAYTAAVGESVQVIGDDYLVTNAARVREAAATRGCNAVLVKPNQVGTLTEAKAALDAARAAGFGTIVSARSGETEDVTIAHLAIGWSAGQLKVGSITRGERTAKWNEVLRIAERLGPAAVFAGGRPLRQR